MVNFEFFGLMTNLAEKEFGAERVARNELGSDVDPPSPSAETVNK